MEDQEQMIHLEAMTHSVKIDKSFLPQIWQNMKSNSIQILVGILGYIQYMSVVEFDLLSIQCLAGKTGIKLFLVNIKFSRSPAGSLCIPLPLSIVCRPSSVMCPT